MVQRVSNPILRRLFLLGCFLFLSLFWCLFILKDCMSRCIKSKQIWTKRIGWFQISNFNPQTDRVEKKCSYVDVTPTGTSSFDSHWPLPESVIHFHNPSWYWKSISSISPFLVRNHPQNRVNGLNPPFLLKKTSIPPQKSYPSMSMKNSIQPLPFCPAAPSPPAPRFGLLPGIGDIPSVYNPHPWNRYKWPNGMVAGWWLLALLLGGRGSSNKIYTPWN